MRSSLLLSASVALAALASAEPSFWRAGAIPRPASTADRQFVNIVARNGRSDVEMSALALTKGSERVRSLAQRIQTDHQKSDPELEDLAGRKRITLEPDLSHQDREASQHLSGLHGDAFDRAFLDRMLRDRRNAIAEFERYSEDGDDADLQAFAEKSLPTLRAQLKLAEAAQAGNAEW